jgi:hypothetical protein
VSDVRHGSIGDLLIAIEPPETEIFDDMVTLIERRGGSGDDIVNAVFDDEAAVPISQAGAPFTGRYRPEQRLSSLIGHPARGSWGVYVENWSETESATINGLGVDVAPAVCDATHNAPPSVDLTASTWSPSAGHPVTYDASRSSDRDGEVTSYRWDLDGDGTYETRDGPRVTVRYPETGATEIGVQVLDDRRGAGERRERVWVVDNMLPVASFEHSTPVVAGRPVRFDAGSAHDPDGRIVRWHWTIGAIHESTEPQFEYTFAEPGHAWVELNVRDDDGQATSVGASIPIEPGDGAGPGTADPGGGDSGGTSGPFPAPSSPLYPPNPGGGMAAVPQSPYEAPAPFGAPPPTVLTISTPPRQRIAALGRGLPLTAGCAGACSLVAKLSMNGKDARRLGLASGVKTLQIARAERLLKRAGSAKLRLRPGRLVVRRLRRMRSVELRLEVIARGAGGTERTIRTLELRR